MLYLGLPLYYNEVVRLFMGILPLDAEPRMEDDHFNTVAATKAGTPIRLHWLDKGVLVLGFQFEEIRANLWGVPRSVEEHLATIQLKKHAWIREMKDLGVDLSRVTLAQMESEDMVVSNPEPFLMEWDG